MPNYYQYNGGGIVYFELRTSPTVHEMKAHYTLGCGQASYTMQMNVRSGSCLFCSTLPSDRSGPVFSGFALSDR